MDDSGAKRLVRARGRGRGTRARLYELKVVLGNGEIETRYCDKGLRVGDRLTVGRRKLAVIKKIAPSSRLEAASFVCLEVPPPPAGAWKRAEHRRAA
jgi:hypothetical protein